MINYTGYDNTHNCYVDPANPYNPWGYRQPYIGDVPCPPYRVTDVPAWQPTWSPPFTIQTTGTTSTSPEQPSPFSFEPSDDDMAEQDDAPDDDHSPDLATMIREIVRDELSRRQHTEKSTKGIARDVLKLLKDELRAQGRAL